MLAPPPPVTNGQKPKTETTASKQVLSSSSNSSFSRHKSEELGNGPAQKLTTKNTPAMSNLIKEHKLSSTNSLLDDELMNDDSIKVNKLFTDSMIALHDDNESTDESNSFMMNGGKENQPSINSNVNDLDDWSNDFGWHKHDNNESSSASLIALSGSNVQLERAHSIFSTTSSSSSSTKQLAVNNNASLNGSQLLNGNGVSLNGGGQRPKYPSVLSTKQPNDAMGAEFDIKSINIKVKKSPQAQDSEENLIESLMNEMQPVIKPTPKLPASATTETLILSSNKTVDKFSVQTNGSAFEMKNLETPVDIDKSSGNSWECDEVIDLENL